jgi:glutaredoxin
MKKITMFTMDSCPYCKSARKWMDDIIKSDEKYKSIETVIIDEVEEPDLAAKFDYYYVPTYYLDGEKVHEGAANFEIVKKIFDEAL